MTVVPGEIPFSIKANGGQQKKLKHRVQDIKNKMK